MKVDVEKTVSVVVAGEISVPERLHNQPPALHTNAVVANFVEQSLFVAVKPTTFPEKLPHPAEEIVAHGTARVPPILIDPVVEMLFEVVVG